MTNLLRKFIFHLTGLLQDRDIFYTTRQERHTFDLRIKGINISRLVKMNIHMFHYYNNNLYLLLFSEDFLLISVEFNPLTVLSQTYFNCFSELFRPLHVELNVSDLMNIWLGNV